MTVPAGATNRADRYAQEIVRAVAFGLGPVLIDEPRARYQASAQRYEVREDVSRLTARPGLNRYRRTVTMNAQLAQEFDPQRLRLPPFVRSVRLRALRTRRDFPEYGIFARLRPQQERIVSLLDERIRLRDGSFGERRRARFLRGSESRRRPVECGRGVDIGARTQDGVVALRGQLQTLFDQRQRTVVVVQRKRTAGAG